MSRLAPGEISSSCAGQIVRAAMSSMSADTLRRQLDTPDRSGHVHREGFAQEVFDLNGTSSVAERAR